MWSSEIPAIGSLRPEWAIQKVLDQPGLHSETMVFVGSFLKGLSRGFSTAQLSKEQRHTFGPISTTHRFEIKMSMIYGWKTSGHITDARTLAKTSQRGSSNAPPSCASPTDTPQRPSLAECSLEVTPLHLLRCALDKVWHGQQRQGRSTEPQFYG